MLLNTNFLSYVRTNKQLHYCYYRIYAIRTKQISWRWFSQMAVESAMWTRVILTCFPLPTGVISQDIHLLTSLDITGDATITVPAVTHRLPMHMAGKILARRSVQSCHTHAVARTALAWIGILPPTIVSSTTARILVTVRTIALVKSGRGARPWRISGKVVLYLRLHLLRLRLHHQLARMILASQTPMATTVLGTVISTGVILGAIAAMSVRVLPTKSAASVVAVYKYSLLEEESIK